MLCEYNLNNSHTVHCFLAVIQKNGQETYELKQNKCYLLEGFMKQEFIINPKEKSYFISCLYLNAQLSVSILHFSLMD